MSQMSRAGGKKGFSQIVADKGADRRRFFGWRGAWQVPLQVPKDSIPQIVCEPVLLEGFFGGVVRFDHADKGDDLLHLRYTPDFTLKSKTRRNLRKSFYGACRQSFEQNRYAHNLRDRILRHLQWHSPGSPPTKKSASICALIRDNLREPLLSPARDICEIPFLSQFPLITEKPCFSPCLPVIQCNESPTINADSKRLERVAGEV